MKIFNCLYVHYYTALHAPKAWFKYISYCATKSKKPNVAMLSKIVKISKIFKSLKTEPKYTVNNTTNKNTPKLYYKC